jgi:hypothetical protein
VGVQAAGAILDAVLRVCKAATAFIPQCIQGAVTKDAAEFIRVSTLVTGKIFTGGVLKKFIIVHRCLLVNVI